MKIITLTLIEKSVACECGCVKVIFVYFKSIEKKIEFRFQEWKKTSIKNGFSFEDPFRLYSHQTKSKNHHYPTVRSYIGIDQICLMLYNYVFEMPQVFSLHLLLLLFHLSFLFCQSIDSTKRLSDMWSPNVQRSTARTIKTTVQLFFISISQHFFHSISIIVWFKRFFFHFSTTQNLW